MILTDYYKELILRISRIRPETFFTINQAYGDGWSAIPGREKISMSLRLKEEAGAGRIENVMYCGMIEGRTHRHKLYKKL